MKREPEHSPAVPSTPWDSNKTSTLPGIEGEATSRRDRLIVRLGGPRTLWILLAVLLCIVSSGLMMLLPSKSVDVESVYGGI